MENVNVCETVLDKKLDGYGVNMDNFVAGSEITVEITLSEYRTLVSHNATRGYEIDKANADKYERDSENARLKKQIEELKAENYELKKQLENKKEDETNE